MCHAGFVYACVCDDQQIPFGVDFPIVHAYDTSICIMERSWSVAAGLLSAEIQLENVPQEPSNALPAFSVIQSRGHEQSCLKLKTAGHSTDVRSSALTVLLYRSASSGLFYLLMQKQHSHPQQARLLAFRYGASARKLILQRPEEETTAGTRTHKIPQSFKGSQEITAVTSMDHLIKHLLVLATKAFQVGASSLLPNSMSRSTKT